MNFSFYIMGTPEGLYSQYPNDYTVSTLSNLQEGIEGAKLVIYRDMDLVHYVYTERIETNAILGFCLIFNKGRILKPTHLVQLFRFIIENKLVESGNLIRYSDDGVLKFNVKTLNECVKNYEYLKAYIDAEFENNPSKYDIQPLSTIYNGVKTSTSLDKNVSDGQIISMTNQYNKVIVNEDTGIENGYIPQLIMALREKNRANLDEINVLQSKLRKAEIKKKNITWVAVLGTIVLFFGFVLWNKVLFPSEVTHYETGEFVYYGPIEDGKPNGVGVAIYPTNDKDGRKYYIGNFRNGERQDSAAILFYQDGDYYYGSMEGDRWKQGMLYMNSDNSHFVGTFQENNPYTGKWYDHENSQKSYSLYEGKNAIGVKILPKHLDNKAAAEGILGNRRMGREKELKGKNSLCKER